MNKESLMQTKHSNEEKLKAAYALNMCTVSVSQIVDYNDLYVLEQEYDAILNNLNLKQMPKDEALLRIISELLNTITFFRIQEIKKSQIEKKYKQKLKNAIWSAVPSLSVVVSGNPVAIALSLATQIGSGYMNYRREKANIASDKEDAEIELQITAIEQLNALRRELFTTAWRLADEYDFNDESHRFYIRDHHPESAIIDRDLWDRVKAILQEKSSAEEVKTKHSNRYWTSGKVFCGLCGQRYVSYVKKQKNVPYRAWVCFENHQRGKYKQTTLDTGETTTVGCNAHRVNDRVLKTAVHDIITDYLIPHKESIIGALRSEIETFSAPKDKRTKILSLEKAIAKKKEHLAKLTQGWMDGTVPESAYQATIEIVNAEYEELQQQLNQMQTQPSAKEEIAIYKDYIKQVEEILSLSADDRNDGFYERITKQIFVYPHNLLKFRLSFIPMPIYMQYKVTGKGDFYKVELTILTAEQFALEVKNCPKNELPTTESYNTTQTN